MPAFPLRAPYVFAPPSPRRVLGQISLSAIMLQLSSLIALLWLAGFSADFLMLHVLPERKHYRTYKQARHFLPFLPPTPPFWGRPSTSS